MMAEILAKKHGFNTTVLFAIDKKTGAINPDQTDNIPGLEHLRDADLMVLFIRWRNLPDKQTKEIIDYTMAGKPSSPFEQRRIRSTGARATRHRTVAGAGEVASRRAATVATSLARPG